MLGCMKPMSSPMMKRMLGFDCCADAGAVCCCAVAGVIVIADAAQRANRPTVRLLGLSMIDLPIASEEEAATNIDTAPRRNRHGQNLPDLKPNRVTVA